MSQSPFKSNHTIFLLFGLTDDQFCLPDTRMVNLSPYLDIHLRSIGFKQLAFHHPLNGVRIIGAPLEQQPPAPSRSTLRASAGKSLVSGPLGQIKVISSPASPRTVQPETKTYDRMTDTELPTFIQSFFKGQEHQALIFEQFEYLIDFNREAIRTFWALLRDIQTQSTGREKIIFLSNSLTTDLLENFQNNQHFLWSFKDHFFDRGAIRPNVIRIGPPDADEILNLQRRSRLRNHVRTNFSSLVQNCEKNATELRQKTEPATFSLKSNMESLESYDWKKEENTESALNRLEALPGLNAVAKRIRSDVDYAQDLQNQENNGQAEDGQRDQKPAVERLLDHSDEAPPVQVNLNYALAGNPGTGKTITARLIAEAFKEAGILRSGHFIEATVQDLVGEYVGQSAIKANDLLSRARGGVLFIDEVQGFEKDNKYHREAIRTILKYAEDYRGDISVIVATYPGEMDTFLSIDQGLPRRFPQRIDLEDYDAATCVDIFNYMAKERLLEVDPDLQKTLEGFFNTWINDRTKKEAFSNAGSVRNLIEEMDRVRFKRGSGEPLRLNDVPEEYRAYKEEAALWTGDPDARLEHALAELNALTGLASVKEAVQRIVDGIKVARLTGQEATIVPGHYSFEGNPGTGKTTVARLLGNIFRELGVMKSGHVVEVTRSDFVGRHLGDTENNVREITDRALDGVLFIDEAHNLVQHNEHDMYGQAAIGELTPILENARGRLCVIMAGYPEQMAELFEQDPGWKSRIPNRIHFEDYEPQEMAQIMRQMCKERGFTLHSDLEENLQTIFARLCEAEGRDFANGRSVRNFFGTLEAHRNSRLIANEDDVKEGKIDPSQLILEDVPEKYQAYSEEAARRTGDPDARLEHALEELNALTGLTTVKRAVEGIVYDIKGQRRRGQTDSIVPGHYSFEGNPGTGKTTVARLLGNIFHELGVLKSDHVVEVTRSDLVAQYMGQTAPKVREQTNKAMNGVLFIDEAHNLIQGEQDQYGKEAIGELTAILENERERLCVIVAGYPEPMARLFEQDPGWKSRFTNQIHFEDYEPPEIAQITCQMCKEGGFTLHPDLEENLESLLAGLREAEGEDFANGRSVRNFFGTLVRNLNIRLKADKEEKIDPFELILEDVPEALRP